MLDFISNHFFIRLFFSFGGFFLFFSLGLMYPFRKSTILRKPSRWFTNLLFSFGNAALIRLLLPLSLIQILHLGSLNPFKLVHWNSVPTWLFVITGVLSLDLIIYWQHRLTHKVPLLWRLHRVHHSDLEIDATSAGRFHILEIVFSFFVKATFAVTLNLHPLSILIFEVILNFSSLFNHTNIQLPQSLEKFTRLFLITPDIHRIHHSTVHNEMNSNFGFSISLWDRLFRSYCENGDKPQENLEIGLLQFRSEKEQTTLALLKQPFLKN